MIIRSYLVSIYFKIKDKIYISKLLKLFFIIYVSQNHINDEYKLNKLGKTRDDFINVNKSCQNSIPLFMYKNHLMLYDLNIIFNYQVYNNTF